MRRRIRHAAVAVVAAGAVAGAGVLTAPRHHHSGSQAPVASSIVLGPMGVPGSALNPAVTQATIGSTICVPGWTATVRPPASYTSTLKVHQIAERHYADTNPADFEEDHAASLGLGGSPTSPVDLWPESLPLAKQDDLVEVRLQREVCAGQIGLDAARAQIWALKVAHGL